MIWYFWKPWEWFSALFLRKLFDQSWLSYLRDPLSVWISYFCCEVTQATNPSKSSWCVISSGLGAGKSKAFRNLCVTLRSTFLWSSIRFKAYPLPTFKCRFPGGFSLLAYSEWWWRHVKQKQTCTLHEFPRIIYVI